MHPLIPIERAEVFCEGLDHPECAAVHPDGSVWAGGEAGQVYRIAPDGQSFEEIASTGGFTLGIAFSPGADWLAMCDVKGHKLWRLEVASGRLEPLADTAGDHQLQLPNHASFDSAGNLYVSDSGAFGEVCGKLLRFDAADPQRGEVWHKGPFHFANGTALSPDGRWLYVACTWLPGVERVEVRSDGAAGRREVYATTPGSLPDGLAFDAAGRLYVSCYEPSRIYRVDVDRTVTLLLEDREAHTLCHPTNIAFGGEQMSTLYIANLGRWHLTRLNGQVAGQRLASHRRDISD